MLSCWALGKLARLRGSAPPVEEIVDEALCVVGDGVG